MDTPPLSESPSKTLRYAKQRLFASVPYKYHSELAQAQLNVSKYFHQCTRDHGLFQMGSRRYVILRAGSLSCDLRSALNEEEETTSATLYPS